MVEVGKQTPSTNQIERTPLCGADGSRVPMIPGRPPSQNIFLTCEQHRQLFHHTPIPLHWIFIIG